MNLSQTETQYRETLMNGQHTNSPQTFFENNLTEWSPDLFIFFNHLIMVSVLGEQNAKSQAHVQVKCVSVIVFVKATL